MLSKVSYKLKKKNAVFWLFVCLCMFLVKFLSINKIFVAVVVNLVFVYVFVYLFVCFFIFCLFVFMFVVVCCYVMYAVTLFCNSFSS